VLGQSLQPGHRQGLPWTQQSARGEGGKRDSLGVLRRTWRHGAKAGLCGQCYMNPGNRNMERDGNMLSKKPMSCHHEVLSTKVIQALQMLLQKRLLCLWLFDPAAPELRRHRNEGRQWGVGLGLRQGCCSLGTGAGTWPLSAHGSAQPGLGVGAPSQRVQKTNHLTHLCLRFPHLEAALLCLNSGAS